MNLKSRHLLGIAGLTPEEITLILDTAEGFAQIATREIKKVPTLRGKTVINFFVEPSTRTRSSVEVAEKRLSADSLNFAASASSLVKGETLLDTARNLEAMAPDFIVIRHSQPGAPHFLARHCRSAIVNAGDGALDALGVAAGQIADVAHAGKHEVLGPQVLVDGLGLGGRLDDHQVPVLGGPGGVGGTAATEAASTLSEP